MDSYQAIYDAVRSRISGGNIADAITQACRENFDISYARASIQQSIESAVMEYQRPSAVYRPDLHKDGNAWIALYGQDLVIGVVGTGDSPDAAMRDFDKAWYAKSALNGGE